MTIAANCNVQCGKTPYHTYQEQNGRLVMDIAYQDNNPMQVGVLKYNIPGGGGTQTIEIPKNSILVGIISNITDPAISEVTGNTRFYPITNAAFGMGGVGIDSAQEPINIYEYEGIRKALDVNLTLADTVRYFIDGLPFMTCEGFKLESTNGATMFNNGEPLRGIKMAGIGIPDGFYFSPVYLDFSWLFGTNYNVD